MISPHTQARAEYLRTLYPSMPLVEALAHARALVDGERRGLTFRTEEEQEPWDGMDPAPRYVLCCFVYQGSNWPIASLGMVGVDTMRDPYLVLVQADLFAEALLVLDQWDQDQADTLFASRPTYAGPTP